MEMGDLKVLALSGLVLAMGPGMAMSPGECLTLDHRGNGSSLRNTCDQTIHVAVCVANPGHGWHCGKSGRGLLTLQSGAARPVVDLHLWPGEVRWAACASPLYPEKWTGDAGRGRYACN